MALLTVKSESDLYERICATLVRAEDTCSCWIGLVEPGTCIVKPVAQAGFEDAHIPSMEVAGDDGEHGLGPAEVAIKTGQPFVVGDILRNPRLATWRDEALRRGYASMAALPSVHDGETVGALNVYSGKSHAFGSEQMELLREVASNIAIGTRSIRLEEEIKASKEFVETVFNSLSDSLLLSSENDTLRVQ